MQSICSHNLIRKLGLPVLLVASSLILNSCNQSKANDVKSQNVETRKLCFVDVGGTFGKSAMRARQYIGSGPKFRLVQWKTLDYPDELHPERGQLYYNNRASLAVMISWRASIINDRVDSQLDSIKVIPVNFKEDQLKKITSWRITSINNDKYDFPASDAPRNGETEVFSSQARGISIPSTLVEYIGGANGSSFRIGVLSKDGVVLLQKQIDPLMGYLFKERTVAALDKLDAMIENPENCQIVSEQSVP